MLKYEKDDRLQIKICTFVDKLRNYKFIYSKSKQNGRQ